MDDLAALWKAMETWDRERAIPLEFAPCQAQLYRGAMEIPLVAFYPIKQVKLDEARMVTLASALPRFGLELDCVEIGSNYKINRADSHEYVGRIAPDALKLHVDRILDIGDEAFREIVTFYLRLR